jgi:hypothetical protein
MGTTVTHARSQTSPRALHRFPSLSFPFTRVLYDGGRDGENVVERLEKDGLPEYYIGEERK